PPFPSTTLFRSPSRCGDRSRVRRATTAERAEGKGCAPRPPSEGPGAAPTETRGGKKKGRNRQGRFRLPLLSLGARSGSAFRAEASSAPGPEDRHSDALLPGGARRRAPRVLHAAGGLGVPGKPTKKGRGVPG